MMGDGWRMHLLGSPAVCRNGILCLVNGQALHSLTFDGEQKPIREVWPVENGAHHVGPYEKVSGGHERQIPIPLGCPRNLPRQKDCQRAKKPGHTR